MPMYKWAQPECSKKESVAHLNESDFTVTAHFYCKHVTTLQAVTWAGAARRTPRRRNSAEGRCTPSGRTGPGVQRPEAPTTNEVLLAACRVLASRAGETSRAECSRGAKCSHNEHLRRYEQGTKYLLVS